MANSNLSIGLAFVSGIVTVLSPCILPILPIIIGRSLQSHRYGPIALIGGLVASFAVVGSLLGFAASWFSELTDTLRSVAIGILLLMGILSIFPQLGYRFFRIFSFKSNSNSIRQGRRYANGLGGEFVLGTQLGLLWTPCAGSILASILVLAAVEHQPLPAFGLLTVYGLGAAMPMLTIAYGSRYTSDRLLKLRSHSTQIQKIGGIVIIITAIAMLLGLDVQIQLWLAPLFPNFNI